MMSKENKTYIGAHVSAAGGISKSPQRARDLGVDVMQIHASSPRQWHVRFPHKKEVERFKREATKNKIAATFLHAPYLINLATGDSALGRKSVNALVGHMRIAHSMGAEGVIFHIGSVGKSGDKEKAAERIAGRIRETLQRSPGHTRLIIENAAGAGGTYGAIPQEVGVVFRAMRSARLKLCVDTAHAFGAGVLETNSKAVRTFFDEWERAAGKENLVAIHANDSKVPLASRKDRHENLGEGYIGLDGLALIAADRRAKNVPWILEVPGFAGQGPDRKNVERLRSVIQ